MSPQALREFRRTAAAFGGLAPPVHQIALSYARAEDREASCAARVVLLDPRKRGIRRWRARLRAVVRRLVEAPAAAAVTDHTVAA